MRRATAACIFLSALMLGCGRVEPPAPLATVPASCKPEAPFQLSARFVGDPQAGATCGLIVSITALTEGDVSLQVSLPAGVSLVRGSLSFAGPLRKGEARELKLDVSITDAQRREITAYGSLSAAGFRFAGATTVVLNEDGSIPASRGIQKRNARGESILEFTAE